MSESSWSVNVYSSPTWGTFSFCCSCWASIVSMSLDWRLLLLSCCETGECHLPKAWEQQFSLICCQRALPVTGKSQFERKNRFAKQGLELRLLYSGASTTDWTRAATLRVALAGNTSTGTIHAINAGSALWRLNRSL